MSARAHERSIHPHRTRSIHPSRHARRRTVRSRPLETRQMVGGAGARGTIGRVWGGVQGAGGRGQGVERRAQGIWRAGRRAHGAAERAAGANAEARDPLARERGLRNIDATGGVEPPISTGMKLGPESARDRRDASTLSRACDKRPADYLGFRCESPNDVGSRRMTRPKATRKSR